MFDSDDDKKTVKRAEPLQQFNKTEPFIKIVVYFLELNTILLLLINI
jgi:hypothetical protein